LPAPPSAPLRTPRPSTPSGPTDALTRSLEAGGVLALPGPRSGPGVDLAGRLRHLAGLRAAGVLSASEFEAQKLRVLRAAVRS
jgi:hypothetical protein